MYLVCDAVILVLATTNRGKVMLRQFCFWLRVCAILNAAALAAEEVEPDADQPASQLVYLQVNGFAKVKADAFSGLRTFGEAEYKLVEDSRELATAQDSFLIQVAARARTDKQTGTFVQRFTINGKSTPVTRFDPRIKRDFSSTEVSMNYSVYFFESTRKKRLLFKGRTLGRSSEIEKGVLHFKGKDGLKGEGVANCVSKLDESFEHDLGTKVSRTRYMDEFRDASFNQKIAFGASFPSPGFVPIRTRTTRKREQISNWILQNRFPIAVHGTFEVFDARNEKAATKTYEFDLEPEEKLNISNTASVPFSSPRGRFQQVAFRF